MESQNIRKNIGKLILISVFCWLTSGCAPSTLPVYTSSTNLEDKAVIVLNVTASQVNLAKFDENYNNVNIKPIEHIMDSSSSFNSAFYVIDPGIYYISYAATTVTGYNYQTTYSTALRGLTPEGRIVYGAFEVKAGEVGFLGTIISHLISPPKDNTGLFTIAANLEDTKTKILNSRYTRSKFKPLVPKLRQITFYPAGSRIYRDKQGKYKLAFS